MRSLTILATEVYQKLGKQFPNLTERREATKQHLLKEITQWGVKQGGTNTIIAFKPIEFQGNAESEPFEVRLIYDEDDGFWELEFGNLNAQTPEEQFNWNDKDPYRLQKALFLQNVLNRKIVPFLSNMENEGIKFQPYSGDGLEDDRLSYFQNMFKKLNKDEFEFSKGYFEEDENYYITKKI